MAAAQSVSRSSRARQYYRQRRTAAAKTPKPVITAASSLTDALSNPSATPLDALANILDIKPPSAGVRRSCAFRKGALIHTPPRDILRLPQSSPQPPQLLTDRLLGGTVPCVCCDRPGRLPAEASRLLSEPSPFLLRNHNLWPSASARWGKRSFLEAELDGVSCAVLSAPSSVKDFSYWMAPRRWSSLEEALKRGGDRVLGPYAFDEPSVDQLNLTISEFFKLADGKDAKGRGRCLYLQHPVVKAQASQNLQRQKVPSSGSSGRMTASMQPAPGLGPNMASDITSGLNRDLLEEVRVAGRLGPWSLTVLFVGTSSASGTRTRLHYDQVDNLYLQVAGVKTFRLFSPTEGGSLYPYPWHHPMDRSAQVDLNKPNDTKQASRYPRFAEARGMTVTLHPGDALFLPAYWWHEVLTDGPSEGDNDQLIVSVNFWFSAHPKLSMNPPPEMPLTDPMLLVELSQQVQMLIADALNDKAALVPPFLRALNRQFEASLGGKGSDGKWLLLHKGRPKDVDASEWEGLYLYVVGKLLLLLESPQAVLAFLDRHCDVSKFERLVLRS